ncbi:MAG: fibrobacter succinogenes major paralogous domain-containing protein [Bacteroidales bacterium]|jgi:uncharacterized protein (TIGR02145 family)|nr:fibrobacter succinogenes major paralogous domain-containing protein [Bacteroidales bacterium]
MKKFFLYALVAIVPFIANGQSKTTQSKTKTPPAKTKTTPAQATKNKPSAAEQRRLAQQKPGPDGCVKVLTGWGKNPGKVDFQSKKTWTIGKFEWSDAVVAENCAKDTFDGGKPKYFMSDCKRVPGGHGDLFSWCAVKLYGAKLCTRNGWRVPSKEDFMNLEKALEKMNSKQRKSTTSTPKHELWGISFNSKCCDGQGDPLDQGSYAFYWSNTEFNADYGLHLSFNISDNCYPQSNSSKAYGFTLRCVRDIK